MIVADLIRQSYFTAHVTGEGEEAEGFRAVEGLQFLNEIIDDWGSSGVYIPYNNTTVITTTANVPSYQITPVIIQIDEANLQQSTNVQYPLIIADTHAFNQFNFELLTTRPNYVYLSTEQTLNDDGDLCSTVWVYPTPDQAYTINLIQKSQLQEVELFDNLSALPPRIYKTLRYQLAADLQTVYGTELPEKFYTDLRELVAKMQATNPTDYSLLTQDPFHTQRRFSPWGYGNGVGGGVL
jgi:hypothetical protein